jgi:DNA (cytosine-5)-methyltransferase 1
MKSATLFSGGGLADCGVQSAGGNIRWGLEYHRPAADIYQANYHHDPYGDLLDSDPRDFEPVDYLHLSSPCQSFSDANSDKGEKASDLLLAHKCGEFIKVLRPIFVSIENVPAYKGSDSLLAIMKVLSSNYKHIDSTDVDFANFGVPQNRKRVIIRASNMPLKPLHEMYTHGSERTFFVKQYESWYDHIIDLKDDFQETQFTVNQLRSIEHFKPKTPYLIKCIGFRGRNSFGAVREWDRPSWTICASSGGDNRSGNRYKVIDMVGKDGRCLSLTHRAVARLMGCPDSFILPKTSKPHEIWRVLGNGVPPIAMRSIVQSFY